MTLSPETNEYGRNLARFADLAARYRGDAELRERLDRGDAAAEVRELGIEPIPGVDMRIVVDTDEVTHIAFPSDPNMSLGDESLHNVAGGETAGSASTIATASSFGCSTVPSSLGSAGSVGTAGSRS